eukprot:6466830-Karenia_brevis.AAC.1
MGSKKFITRSGKEFTLGTWIRAVQQGQTAPKAAEALQLLHDMHQNAFKNSLPLLKQALIGHQ